MNPKRNRTRDIGFYVLIFVLIACTVYMLTTSKDTDKMTYSEVKDLFTSEKVQSFVYDGTSNKLTMKVRDASAKNGTKEVAYNMYSFSLFYEDLGDTIEQQYKDGIIKEYQIEPIRSSWWIQLIPYILLVGLMVFWVVMMTKANGGGGVGGGGGTAKSAYMITVENTKNGEVVSSHKTADKGDTVTLTATPDKGYAIRRIIVTDSSDQKLTLTEKDGKYTFTMPSSNVTVKTTFIMDKSKDEVPNPFADVSANSYYYDAVQWAVKNGTTGGTSATTFSPDAPCTRAQAVTFLWRAAGSPAPSSTEMPFADVPADAYYRNAVLWAVENGITGGTSATTFSPDAPCSRGQIVAFLWRSKQSPMVAAENPFMDVNAADYYHDAVLWAAENGITGGTGANTFSPDAPCTRAQIVTFLYRVLHK